MDQDWERDEIDDLFDELDKSVEYAEENIKKGDPPDTKYGVTLEIMDLMMEEVPSVDIKIYQQEQSDLWMAEVKYRGITFFAVAGKTKPETWEEFEQK